MFVRECASLSARPRCRRVRLPAPSPRSRTSDDRMAQSRRTRPPYLYGHDRSPAQFRFSRRLARFSAAHVHRCRHLHSPLSTNLYEPARSGRAKLLFANPSAFAASAALPVCHARPGPANHPDLKLYRRAADNNRCRH